MSMQTGTVFNVERSDACPPFEELPQPVDRRCHGDEKESSGTDERPTAKRGESGEHAHECGRSIIRIPELDICLTLCVALNIVGSLGGSRLASRQYATREFAHRLPTVDLSRVQANSCERMDELGVGRSASGQDRKKKTTASTKKELTTKEARLAFIGKAQSGRRPTCQRWTSGRERRGAARFNRTR
jgi:hypothetical protein